MVWPDMGDSMEDLKELKSLLSDELEESFRRGIINNMPRIPMVVVYTDEEAKKAKEEIDPILQHIWGDRKKAIVQVAMEGELFSDADSGENLAGDEVQELIDQMYASDNCFKDMSCMCVVFIHTTVSCDDVSVFRERFERVHQIEEFISDNHLTASIVFLDESTKCRRTAGEIRNYLGDLLEQKNNPYTSTFLLSNRLSNGSLLAGKRIKENYDMAGWIILLLNGVGAGYAPDLSLFYPAGKEYYLTAAFSEVNRPNDAICDIVLHTMLTWIDRRIGTQGKTKTKNLDIGDYYQRLEISGNQAKFLEDFFQQNIVDKIPPVDVIRYLPRQHTGEMDITAMDFGSVDRETMGGCSAMLAGLCLFDRQMRDDLVRFVQNYLRHRLSAAEKERVLSVSNIQELLRQIRPGELTGKERINVYLREKVHADYLNWALPICEEILINEQKNSAAHTKEFEGILQEFQQGYFPDDTDLERYYADITKDELERAAGGLGERLISEISLYGEQRSAVLDCLKKAAQEIFSSKAVFRMPLEQEMVSRMGQNPNDIHNQIYNTLFRDLDNRIRLKTAIALSAQKQITIVNQRGEDGMETELYQSIKKNISDAANMIYFDSCNSNTIKILRFYACGRANLL